MSLRWRRWWQPIAAALDGPAAVSWTGLLAVLPGMVVNDALHAEAAERPAAGAAVIGLAAWAATALFLQAWNLVVLRPRPPGLPRRRLALAGYLGAGAVRVATIAVLLPPAEAPRPGVILLRLVSTAVWLAAIAVVVHWQRGAAEQLATLAAEHERLRRTRHDTTAELARTRSELAAVRARTSAAIGVIVRRLRPDLTAAQLHDLTELIGATIRQQIRPTSHALARMPDPPMPSDAQPLWPSPWRQTLGIVGRWSLAAPFQPVPVALFTVPVASAKLLSDGQAAGVAQQLAGLAAQLLVLAAAARWLAPALPRWPAWWRPVPVVACYVAMLAIGVQAGEAAARAGGTPVAEVTLLPFGVTIFTAGAAAIQSLVTSAAAEARRVLAQIEWDVSHARQQLWAERRRLALVLHGRVQANLTAAELLLAGLGDAGAETRAEVIERVRATLSRAAELDLAARRPGLAERVADLAAVWQGVMTVSIRIEPPAARRLADDPDATDAATEILRELLLNAVRHGHATEVRACVDLVDTQTLGIDVVEDHPVMPAASATTGAGIGTGLLDALTLSRAIEDRPGQRRTRATLTIADAGRGAGVPRQPRTGWQPDREPSAADAAG